MQSENPEARPPTLARKERRKLAAELRKITPRRLRKVRKVMRGEDVLEVRLHPAARGSRG